jgi:hypothetical protein
MNSITWVVFVLLGNVKLQQVPLATIEFRRNSLDIEGLLSDDVTGERIRFDQLRMKWEQGKAVAKHYEGMLGEKHSKADFALYPNESSQSILDLIFFARGLLHASENHSVDNELSDADIKNVVSNPDLWIHKYDIQTDNQTYDCLYRPFQVKCCQEAAQIFPELANETLMENRQVELKKFMAGFTATQSYAQLTPESVNRRSIEQLLGFLENIQAKRLLEELEWKMTKSGSSYGAHNLLHQLYLDLENLLSQISEGLPFKKLSSSLIHTSNMIDIAVTLKVTSAVCLNVAYQQSDSSNEAKGNCTGAKIPETIQFEVYRVDHNLFVRVFVDGKQFTIEPERNGLTSAFNAIRYLDSLDTSDYYILCNRGQSPRINRAQIKNEKLTKYYFWFGVLVSIVVVIKRLTGKKQATQSRQQTIADSQTGKVSKPKRD